MATEPKILTSGLFAGAENVRRTVFRLVVVLLGATLVAYPFAKYLLHFIKQPLGVPLVIYAPLEGFLGYVKVSVAAGFLLASPLLLYEVKRFLQSVCRMPPPVALGGTMATGGLFLLGVSFCYVAILPVTLGFLLSFGGDNIAAGISVSRYLSLTLGLAATCGAIFELPLVVVILHRLGLISIAFLTQNRRYAVLVGAIVTAVITPTPDAFTMTLLLVPLLGLYESSIIVLRVIERRAAAQANDND
jgi:sec-independent protein translocase protein TatC